MNRVVEWFYTVVPDEPELMDFAGMMYRDG